MRIAIDLIGGVPFFLFLRLDAFLRRYHHRWGCIRLAEPKKLAEYLLRHKPEWSSEKISKAMWAGKEKWVTLEEPVPVSILYFTAWVDPDGLLHFREDIYGHDRKMADRLFELN